MTLTDVAIRPDLNRQLGQFDSNGDVRITIPEALAARRGLRKGTELGPYVVTDRNLLSGQNPASSAPLAEAVIKALS
jgi:hypothetical protein